MTPAQKRRAAFMVVKAYYGYARVPRRLLVHTLGTVLAVLDVEATEVERDELSCRIVAALEAIYGGPDLTWTRRRGET